MDESEVRMDGPWDAVLDVLERTDLYRKSLGSWKLDATHGGGKMRTMMAAIVASLAEWRTPPPEDPADAHSRGSCGGVRDLRGPYRFRLIPLAPVLLTSALHPPSPRALPEGNGKLPDKHTPESYAAKMARTPSHTTPQSKAALAFPSTQFQRRL